jgi:hypothetical protein
MAIRQVGLPKLFLARSGLSKSLPVNRHAHETYEHEFKH